MALDKELLFEILKGIDKNTVRLPRVFELFAEAIYLLTMESAPSLEHEFDSARRKMMK